MLLQNSLGTEQLQGQVCIFSPSVGPTWTGRPTESGARQLLQQLQLLSLASHLLVSSDIHLLTTAGEVLQALPATFGQEAGYRAFGGVLLAHGYLGSALKVP